MLVFSDPSMSLNDNGSVDGSEEEIKTTLEYRVNKSSTAEINKHYLVEFKNGIQTEMRKCLLCDLLVKAPNGGTTGLNKHFKACMKKKPGKRKLESSTGSRTTLFAMQILEKLSTVSSYC